MKNLNIKKEDIPRLVKLHESICYENNFRIEAYVNKNGFEVLFFDLEDELHFINSYVYADVTDREVFEDE